MEKTTLQPGQRLYRNTVTDNGDATVRKGTIYKVHKKAFSKHHTYIVLWDDGQKEKVSGEEAHQMVDNRAEQQSY